MVADWRNMTQAELDAAYDNSRAVVDSPQILAGFEERSRALAERRPEFLDLRYGPRERQRIDLFSAGSAGSPLLVFIHGGSGRCVARRPSVFWRRGRCGTAYRGAARLHARS